MATIENNKEETLSQAIQLLEKITQQQKACGIQFNWSGNKLTWVLTASNITAEEWNPSAPEQRLPKGVTVEQRPRLIHRQS